MKGHFNSAGQWVTKEDHTKHKVVVNAAGQIRTIRK